MKQKEILMNIKTNDIDDEFDMKDIISSIWNGKYILLSYFIASDNYWEFVLF